MPGAAGRHHGGRGCLVFRQPADLAGHGRDYAARRPQGAGTHRSRIQSGADAQPHLHQGRHCVGQHRSQTGAGRPAARHRRGARVQLQRAHVHARPDACAGCNRRHHRIRCHRRRKISRADIDVHGGSRQPERQGVQPLRLHYAQTGLHLRRAGPWPDRTQPQFRHGLGHGRLAAVPVPAKNRLRYRAETA